MNKDVKMTVLTEEILKQGLSSKGGYSRRQTELFEVHGFYERWKNDLIGRSFPNKVIKEFIALKDFHLLPVKDYYWTSIYPDASECGPTRMLMVHTQVEAEKTLRRLKKHTPENKFYWTCSDEFGENHEEGLLI